MELAAPTNTSRLVPCLFFGTFLAVNLLAALAFGARWFGCGDGFEVHSTALGRLAACHRRCVRPAAHVGAAATVRP